MNLTKRGFRDRDFLRTPENFFFCVIGNLHPEDRVISYIRYKPSENGKWGKDSERYHRSMPSYTIPELLKNIEILQRDFPEYVFFSEESKIMISAIPIGKIKEHYIPEMKLKKLLDTSKLDALQEKALELALNISDESGVPTDYLGITGSILINIHRPEFSDIDLTVYGKENAQRVKNTLISLYEEEGDGVKKLSGEALRKWCDEKVADYPVSFHEAYDLYQKKWNYGLYKETNFSVHPVRLDAEIENKYGDIRYKPAGMVKLKANILDDSDSLFLPYTYKLEKVVVEEGNLVENIEEVTTYEGLYGGIFDIGNEIIVKGKLEQVFDEKKCKTYYRVLVGSPEGKGTEYIKPIFKI